jgi:hypothetical protein
MAEWRGEGAKGTRLMALLLELGPLLQGLEALVIEGVAGSFPQASLHF